MPEAGFAGLALGYLIGSIPVGLWIGHWLSGEDLRGAGSGKIGATNAYRRFGLQWSLTIFLFDVAKGVISVVLIRIAFDSPTAEVLAALAALLGHIYPLYAGFRGGRAAAPGFGALLVLTPTVALTAIITAVIILFLSRVMSLSVLLGLVVASVSQGLLVAYGGEPVAYYGFAVGSWIMITAAHRDNIQRLANGTERVLERRKPEGAPGAED